MYTNRCLGQRNVSCLSRCPHFEGSTVYVIVVGIGVDIILSQLPASSTLWHIEIVAWVPGLPLGLILIGQGWNMYNGEGLEPGYWSKSACALLSIRNSSIYS